MRPNTVSRRTALRSLGTAAIAIAALPSGTVAEDDTPPGRCGSAADPSSTEALAADPDTYVATVDRIVGGRHVVLLLEDGGDLVDQIVTPRDDLPDADEGDVLLVVVEDGAVTESRHLVGETRRRQRERERQFDCLREGSTD